MKKFISIILLAFSVIAMSGKIPCPKVYQYRLYIKDKSHSPYSLAQPEKFLSQKSLERRVKQGLTVDSTDLPVSPYYINRVKQLGLRIMGTSRWHNTIWVESNTDDVAKRVGGLDFVTKTVRLYVSPDSIEESKREEISNSFSPDSLAKGEYGDAFTQINLLNGIKLHQAGFKGKGMTIAIMDAGFQNVDSIPALNNVNIISTADFAPRRTKDIFSEHYHGTMVLSTMATNRPDTMIGTAPEASYVLIRTEDIPTETRAEEDSWTMGAEFADSLGVDVINSSLGYFHWDGDSTGLNLRDLDGRTTFVSQAASMLADKGIILCNSAGNEGCGAWRKISIPADADNILTIGAVDSTKTISIYSSIGPTQDGRIKPDVCSLGDQACVINGSGELTYNYGTSFASPILCGMVACLWQANPTLTAKEIINLVKSRGDRSKCPDTIYGYGIPDLHP